jgi:hypothetical protein
MRRCVRLPVDRIACGIAAADVAAAVRCSRAFDLSALP